MKEILIIVFVVGIVVATSYITQNHLIKTSDELLNELENLKPKIEQAMETNETEEIKQISENITSMWEEINNTWALIVTHDELDLIELSLIGIEAAISVDELEDSIQELEKASFLVGHIKEKEALRLKNIF